MCVYSSAASSETETPREHAQPARPPAQPHGGAGSGGGAAAPAGGGQGHGVPARQVGTISASLRALAKAFEYVLDVVPSVSVITPVPAPVCVDLRSYLCA